MNAFRAAAALPLLVTLFILPLAACAIEGETDELPDRIVSLSPHATEILFALDLGDQVVGVTSDCDYPPGVQGKERVGESRNPDVDLILELDPDFVLATEEQANNTVPRLRDNGIEVLIVSPRSFEELIMNIALVGVITGRSEESSRLVTDMENRVQAMNRTLPDSRPRVCYITSIDPVRASGGDTIIDELIRMAGGENIYSARSGMVQTTIASLASRDPEVILVPDSQSNQGYSLLDLVKSSPGLNQTEAVVTGRVYEINETLVTRPGPRIINGIELLAELIHQENTPTEIR